MTTTDAASRTLAAASQRIDQLAAAAEEHHTRLAEIRRDPDLSVDYRDRLLAEQRERFDTFHRQSILDTRRDMERAGVLAAQRLSAPATIDPRAGQRVGRLLDGGMPPMAAAEILAEAGDVAGLRELRDQLPALVALTVPREQQHQRSQAVERALLAVDRLAAPMLDGDDAAAVKVRLAVDAEAARLDAVSEHAFHHTPDSRMRMAFASLPEPQLLSAAHAS